MSSLGSTSNATGGRSMALAKAKARATHRVVLAGHAVLFAAVLMLLLVTAGFFPAFIVALAWGIALGAHAYIFVIAPELRDQLVASELQRELASTVTRERRTLGETHARAMQKLSAAVAHEIRNPITAAKSLVQQIGDTATSPEVAEHARVAVAELDRVERSISHLLKYAREEELVMSEVRLVPAVDAALASLRDRLAGVSLTRKHADDDSLRADPDAIRRIVVNLVSNAIDAIDERAPETRRISLETGHDLAGAHVWLRVRDNGAGIAPADATDVFEPFRTSKPNGTGLGLAITKKLVEAHGGSIEVVPGVPDGAELLVTLPRSGAE